MPTAISLILANRKNRDSSTVLSTNAGISWKLSIRVDTQKKCQSGWEPIIYNSIHIDIMLFSPRWDGRAEFTLEDYRRVASALVNPWV